SRLSKLCITNAGLVLGPIVYWRMILLLLVQKTCQLELSHLILALECYRISLLFGLVYTFCTMVCSCDCNWQLKSTLILQMTEVINIPTIQTLLSNCSALIST